MRTASAFADNRVVRDTGARYPIMQAPMAWVARAQLVKAVASAGGIGLLETTTRGPAAIQSDVEAVRAATANPFGLNLALAFIKSNPDHERALLEWIDQGHIKFVTTSAGDPGRHIKRLKAAGVKVYHAVPSLEAALKAVDAGVDGLIVEGGEAAGIRNVEPIHTFVLLQAVRERVSVPIVAAGGIVDGRGMAAAFALGAEGVAMGTRFVSSRESPVHDNYKSAIVDAPVNGTILINMPPRAAARALKTEMSLGVASGAREEPPRAAVIKTLYLGGDVASSMGTAGESAGLIREVKPVAQIIDDTVQGFWQEIDRLAALRNPT